MSKEDWDSLGDIGGLDMLIWEGKGGSGGGWSSIYIWDKVDNNAWEVESVFFGRVGYRVCVRVYKFSKLRVNGIVKVEVRGTYMLL